MKKLCASPMKCLPFVKSFSSLMLWLVESKSMPT